MPKQPSSKKNEIWVSNPVGNDFKIDVENFPHAGDFVSIGGKVYKVKGTLYKPTSTEYEKVNECQIMVELEDVALDDAL